jgi:hypothetical protein
MSDGTDKYIVADEAKPIAKQLLKEIHQRLKDIRIVYVFVLEPIKEKGREVFGKVSVKSGIDAFLVNEFSDQPQEDFFLLQINKSVWDFYNETQRLGGLDSLLTSCSTSQGKLGVKPYDFMEHLESFARNGDWNHDLTEMKKLAANPLLPGVEPETKSGKKTKVALIKSTSTDGAVTNIATP